MPILALYSMVISLLYAGLATAAPAVAEGAAVLIFVLGLVVPAFWFHCWRKPRRRA